MSATSTRPCPRCGSRLDGAGRCAACGAGEVGALRSGAPQLPDLSALPDLPPLPGLPDPSGLPPLREVPGLRELPALPELPGAHALPPFPGLPQAHGLPELPELAGGAELHPARSPGALDQAAASLASAWRGAPQELYGCKPFELELLVKGVLDDAADGAASGGTVPALRGGAVSDGGTAPSWTADQVAARADFGDPPDGRIAAMAYALHVVRRRRELRAQAASTVHDAEQARARGREALAALGEEIFARRAEAARGSLAPRVEAAAQALAQVEERKQAQVALSAEGAAELAAHDAAIAAAERAAEPDRLRSAKAEDEVARARREAERATALHKRAEIEIRAAQSASEQSAQRIERAQADRQARASQLGAAQDALGEAEVALADAQAALAQHAAAIEALRAKRQAAADEQARRAGAAQGALGQASVGQRAALCELARAALLQNLAPKATAEAAVEVLRKARTASDEAALGAAAIDAYDQDGYRAGVTTAAAVAVALVALLVWLSM